MATLLNKWIGYTQKTLEQIKAAIIAKLPTYAPEITDFSDTNPVIRDIEIHSGLHEQLHYYVDNAARENFLDSARLFASLVKKAKEYDYQIIGYLPYSTTVTFTISSTHVSDITIPAGTIVAYGDIQYVTQAIATVTAGQLTSGQVAVKQYVQYTAISMGTAAGVADEEIEFAGQVVHGSIVIRVNSIAWAAQATLGYSGPTDQHYVQTVNEDGNVIVYFGNEEPYGEIPAPGAPIEADYQITLGADGYAPVGAIDTIISVLSLPGGRTATVTNPFETTGGADIESNNSIKRRLPLARRTVDRAVARGDFAALAMQVPGVVLAIDDYACGKNVNVYIVPTGGGVASSSLLTEVDDYLDIRKTITKNVTVYPVGELTVKITANITANPGYENATVEANAEAALIALFDVDNQSIGADLLIGDSYQAIENADGVVSSEITAFYVEPYPRPLNGTTPALVWTRTLLSGSTATVTWGIVFTTTTAFTLTRNGISVGSFSTGALVSQTEISFTITGTYTAGNEYQFITYPYVSTKIDLQEKSIPAISASDITLNVTGGY